MRGRVEVVVVGEVTGEVSVGVGGCELMCRVLVMIVMSPLLVVGRCRGVEEEYGADMLREERGRRRCAGGVDGL